MNSAPRPRTDWTSPAMARRIRRRYRGERRFRLFGLAAVVLSVGFLALLIATMVVQGAGGFVRHEVAVTIDFPALDLRVDRAQLSRPGADLALSGAGLQNAVESVAARVCACRGYSPVSNNAWLTVRDRIKAEPRVLDGRAVLWLPASSQMAFGARGEGAAAADARQLLARRQLRSVFNASFFTTGNSNDPAAAGIWGALKGSLLTMAVTFLIAVPVGILAAVYLEEFAPRNRWTDLIEVSINNLAAVPSIIFGLLGLAVFLGTWTVLGLSVGPLLPRSAPLVGGVTLALMILPVIVITARGAIRAVPPSVRDGALAIGASPSQVVFHHVLPLAMPGILTGTIIGMARALGETAPLLLIGMRAFILTPPHGFTDPATALPVQIFLWSDEVSRGFVEKTSAAILVLLAVLLTMNALAIWLRNRFETRWQ